MNAARWTAAVVMLGASSPAFADRVVLKDGQILEGVVTERGNSIEIKMDLGTVGFSRREVKSIEKTSSPIAELEKRRAAVSRTDARALAELAAWAEKNGLEAQAHGIYRQVIEVAPEDANARAKLGYKKVDGKWLSEEDEMTAKGFVRHLGRWMKPDEVRVLEEEATLRRRKRAKDDAEARRVKEQREAAEAPSEGYMRAPEVRMDRNYPAYAEYDAATSALYVNPWFAAAIYFPGGYYPAALNPWQQPAPQQPQQAGPNRPPANPQISTPPNQIPANAPFPRGPTGQLKTSPGSR